MTRNDDPTVVARETRAATKFKVKCLDLSRKIAEGRIALVLREAAITDELREAIFNQIDRFFSSYEQELSTSVLRFRTILSQSATESISFDSKIMQELCWRIGYIIHGYFIEINGRRYDLIDGQKMLEAELSIATIAKQAPPEMREIVAQTIRAVLAASQTGDVRPIAELIARAKGETTAAKPAGLQPHALPPGAPTPVSFSKKHVADMSPAEHRERKEYDRIRRANLRAIKKAAVSLG